MGCDIHLFVERREKDGTWRPVPPPGMEPGSITLSWDFRRCYFAFALLAGVRNSWTLEPIVEPRGLPDDLCPELKKQALMDDSEIHTHSWLTLSELLAFDFDQPRTFDALVDVAEFKEYLECGKPRSCSGFLMREISNARMKRLVLTRKNPTKPTRYCTKISFRDTCRTNSGTLPALREKLKALGDPERIRIVFWFDN